MPSANVMPREAYGTNEPSEMLKQVQHDRKEGEDHVSQPAGCDLQDDSIESRGWPLEGQESPPP